MAAWHRARTFLPAATVYFLHQDLEEDQRTAACLRDTADLAGLPTALLRLEDLGWDPEQACFLDPDRRPVKAACKLFPWELLVKAPIGEHLVRSPRPCAFLEPPWKMLLSNRALLAILWELFPHHPYLLPAYLDGPRSLASYVKKPIQARAGTNVELHLRGRVAAAPPGPASGACVYQAYTPLPRWDSFHPVLGAWIVDGEPAGLGLRESAGPITDNRGTFVPHLIEG